MATWKQLNPSEQQELMGEITAMMVNQLPAGWKRLIIDYRVVGRHSGVSIGLRFTDGSTRIWNPPNEVRRLFARLRKGMYAEDQGTWYSFEYILDHPGMYSIKYNWNNEPDFKGNSPSGEDFAVDQRRLPRTEENMPDWFREKLASTPPANG